MKDEITIAILSPLLHPRLLKTKEGQHIIPSPMEEKYLLFR